MAITNEEREQLRKRQQQSYQSKGGSQTEVDSSRGGRDVSFFSPKEGRHMISILPYKVKSGNHPSLKAGDFDYVLDYWIHRNVGPNNGRVLCLARTYNKPCPICEERAVLSKGSVEKAQLDALTAKRMVLYNVVDHENESAGVQLFNVSHYLFEKELHESNYTGDGEAILFSDPDEGAAIRFRCAKEKGAGYEYMKYKDFNFIKRNPIQDAWLNDSLSLDSLLVVPTYAQVKALFFGSGEEEEPKSNYTREPDSDEEPFQSRPKRHADIPVGESLTGNATTASVLPPVVEEAASDGTCPHGHKFGIDTDEKAECDECKVWTACCDARDRAVV